MNRPSFVRVVIASAGSYDASVKQAKISCYLSAGLYFHLIVSFKLTLYCINFVGAISLRLIKLTINDHELKFVFLFFEDR